MAGEVAVLEFSVFLYLCIRLTSEALLFAICFKPETVRRKFWATLGQRPLLELTRKIVNLHRQLLNKK